MSEGLAAFSLRISPTETCWSPRSVASLLHCVPLPTAGPPASVSENRNPSSDSASPMMQMILALVLSIDVSEVIVVARFLDFLSLGRLQSMFGIVWGTRSHAYVLPRPVRSFCLPKAAEVARDSISTANSKCVFFPLSLRISARSDNATSSCEKGEIYGQGYAKSSLVRQFTHIRRHT